MGKMQLHIVDLLVGPVPFGLRTEVLDPFHHDASIPGAVENRNVAVLRHIVPEPPEIVVGFFDAAWRSRRADLIASWIQMAREPADRAALSGRVPSLKAKHHGDSQPVKLAMEHGKLFLELVKLLLILLPFQAFAQICL